MNIQTASIDFGSLLINRYKLHILDYALYYNSIYYFYLQKLLTKQPLGKNSKIDNFTCCVVHIYKATVVEKQFFMPRVIG